MSRKLQRYGQVIAVGVALLSLTLLTGCQTETGSSDAAAGNAATESMNDPKPALPKTEQEWQAAAESSTWFEKDLPDGAEPAELLLADLSGDDKPEIVLPYILQGTGGKPTFGVLAGDYDEKLGEWSKTDEYRYDNIRLNIIEIQPLGKLTTEEGKDVIVLKEELTSASTLNTAIHVMRMAPDGHTLMHSAEFSPDHLAPVTFQDNVLSFTEAGRTVSYNRDGADWLRGDGYIRKLYLKQAPSLYEEPFMQLLVDHPIMDARVDLNEGYEEAKSRLGTPQIEAYDLGGLCSQYDGFNFCNDGQENPIVDISLQVEPTFNIEDVKQYLGEPDEKQHWDIQDYYYIYNYELGDAHISYSTENDDPASRIDEVLIMPKSYEE